MKYHVLTHKRVTPRFDVHLDGVLLNAQSQLTPLYFNKGNALAPHLDRQYIIKVKENFTEIGKFRDKLSVVVNNTALFVVSNAAAEFLQKEAPGQVEFLDLSIHYKEEDITNYKIVNVIQKIECADYENSEIDFENYEEVGVGAYEGSGDIFKINSLSVDENKVPENTDIFLLGPREDAIVIISERLKLAIEETELYGFKFITPEEFAI